MNIVLSNSAYNRFMTSEGEEFQAGLWHAGWTPVGRGYDGIQSIPHIIEKYHPERVVTNDKRDWDPESGMAFDPTVAFSGIECLANFNGLVFVNLKDAGSMPKYHQKLVEETRADGIIIYYHEKSVRTHARWLPRDARLIRTHHSVNRDVVAKIDVTRPRKRCLVSGANSRFVYPLRHTARGRQRFLDLEDLKHPSHGQFGCRTPAYLNEVNKYRVHVATASRYGFALRKIIESVAVCTTPVTNLPEYDVLPEIDGALVRVETSANDATLLEAINRAEEEWNLEERREWARKAIEYYDYRAVGERLSAALLQFRREPCHTT